MKRYITIGLEGTTLPPPDDTTELEKFINQMRIYINNIEEIYDPLNGKEACWILNLTNNNVMCNYFYRSRNDGSSYRVGSFFESKSNVCLQTEECFGTRDNGGYGNNYELGSEANLSGNATVINGIIIRKLP